MSFRSPVSARPPPPRAAWQALVTYRVLAHIPGPAAPHGFLISRFALDMQLSQISSPHLGVTVMDQTQLDAPFSVLSQLCALAPGGEDLGCPDLVLDPSASLPTYRTERPLALRLDTEVTVSMTLSTEEGESCVCNVTTEGVVEAYCKPLPEKVGEGLWAVKLFMKAARIGDSRVEVLLSTMEPRARVEIDVVSVPRPGDVSGLELSQLKPQKSVYVPPDLSLVDDDRVFDRKRGRGVYQPLPIPAGASGGAFPREEPVEQIGEEEAARRAAELRVELLARQEREADAQRLRQVQEALGALEAREARGAQGPQRAGGAFGGRDSREEGAAPQAAPARDHGRSREHERERVSFPLERDPSSDPAGGRAGSHTGAPASASGPSSAPAVAHSRGPMLSTGKMGDLLRESFGAPLLDGAAPELQEAPEARHADSKRYIRVLPSDMILGPATSTRPATRKIRVRNISGRAVHVEAFIASRSFAGRHCPFEQLVGAPKSFTLVSAKSFDLCAGQTGSPGTFAEMVIQFAPESADRLLHAAKIVLVVAPLVAGPSGENAPLASAEKSFQIPLLGVSGIPYITPIGQDLSHSLRISSFGEESEIRLRNDGNAPAFVKLSCVAASRASRGGHADSELLSRAYSIQPESCVIPAGCSREVRISRLQGAPGVSQDEVELLELRYGHEGLRLLGMATELKGPWAGVIEQLQVREDPLRVMGDNIEVIRISID